MIAERRLHEFLRVLSRQDIRPAQQYGLVLGSMVLVTVLRLVLPLNTAPFLLYLPLVFLFTLSYGRRCGFVSVLLSALFAAYFFLTTGVRGVLSTSEQVALVQYLVVGTIVVLACGALRRTMIDSERTLERLAEANASLAASRASLEAAHLAAEASRAEAEAARDAAESANRAKSAFLANMSHELRTPLSAVIGYSEMLEEEIAEVGQGVLLPDLAKIKGNAKHLLSLINDVLDLSKIEANRMDVYAEDVAVAPLLQEVAATVDSLVRQKNNALALQLAPDLGAMHTDAVKLRQCLLNLLSNASKFTSDGRITLAAERREGVDGAAELVFRVADTGIGMTPEQVGRLFQRFTQADESTTRKFGGTGLGLAITRAFVRLLGGDITVESTHGQGTIFTATVPAELPEAAAEPEMRPHASAAPALLADL